MQQSLTGHASHCPDYGSVQETPVLPAERRESTRSVQAFEISGGSANDQSASEVSRGATTNQIHTSKYHWYTFIPLNLYEQFHNLANVYFLFVAFLQMVPSISITSGRPLLLMPLGFVLAVGAARDLFEDEKRKSADRAENERQVIHISDKDGSQEIIRWRDVRPGHIVRIRRAEFIPADALLIGSSASNNGCAVETANLDGETDHKPKVAAFPHGRSWETAQAYRVEFELPSADLYEFKGALLREGDPRIGVGINNLLLRGCTLQQVEWADALVCYCGHDTRVMRNQQGARFKASQLDVEMNSVILVIFVVQLLLCVIGGVSYAMWEAQYFNQAWYLEPGAKDIPLHVGMAMSSLTKAGTWLLQLNNMVPISLIVMITTVKFFQGNILQYDAACYDLRRQKGAEVHTSQVLESLGQVTHIFSDKTGTLTCNEMVYKACAVDGDAYGVSDSQGPASEESDRTNAAPRLHVDFAGGRAALLQHIEQVVAAGDNMRQALVGNFLLCHALCHSVSIQEDGENSNGMDSTAPLTYVASSPDELALVWAAHDLGMSFRGKLENVVNLQVQDSRLITPLAAAGGCAATQTSPCTLPFELLEVCEFDNYRKRMSVVVRYPDGRKIMLMKGADSAILPYLPATSQQEATTHLQRFSRTGLRTLCLAYRELTDGEHGAWSKAYAECLASISEDRAAKVQQLACDLETGKDLKLLGVTAIEDRLQEGVPETLEFVRHAGITVWVLTGDKMETAISIGKSCRLLTCEMENTEIDGGMQEVLASLDAFEQTTTNSAERAITITGPALGVLLTDSNLRLRFYKMARGCHSVICCRVSPKQKADVVELVRELHERETGDKPVTLGIGDGANDVSMITVAHVGVGLSGKEGAQAARAADFAVGQFRFLRRLIFVHGRESYRRNSTLVCYNFYKNMVLVLAPTVFAPFVAFSGQPFYEQVLYQVYNVAFTFWPCAFYAIFDRPVHNLQELERDVRWYTPGLQKRFFNMNVFLHWIIAAILQGVFLPWVAFSTLGHVGKSSGATPDPDSLWLIGTAIFFWVVLCVNLTLWRRLTSNIPLNMFVILGSVLLFPIFVFGIESFGNPYLRGVYTLLFGQNCLQFLLVTVFVVVVFLALGEPLISRATPDTSPTPTAPSELTKLAPVAANGNTV